MSGTLEYDTFKHFAEEFVDVSSNAGDNWCLKSAEIAAITELYITKRVIVYDNELDKETFSQDFYTYDYHIVYSHSYGVPVLYFNAYRLDGSLLKLEELWDRVPELYQKQINESKWMTLTQQDHPILGVPYFTVHPCHTSEFMSSILSVSERKVNYLVPWLSTIGPLAGIKLSSSIAFKLTETSE